MVCIIIRSISIRAIDRAVKHMRSLDDVLWQSSEVENVDAVTHEVEVLHVAWEVVGYGCEAGEDFALGVGVEVEDVLG